MNFKIPSDPQNIIKVESFAEECRQEFEIKDDIFGNILVALTEAVNNAINHGNRLNKNKLVYISIEQKDNKLVYTISDEGSGFDFNNIPDPTDPENIEKPSGRGVFLMKNLADLVIFSDNGSTIEMEFKI